jgi:hypothetical protein
MFTPGQFLPGLHHSWTRKPREISAYQGQVESLELDRLPWNLFNPLFR